MVLIIFWANFAHSNVGSNNLQFQLGDKVSIYSEKAYRKNQGTFFEAVGNVVIKSGQDTLYGEKASLDMEKGEVSIEGNVRYIGQGITIYGSHMQFYTESGQMRMTNARIITADFTIVAGEVFKKAQRLYDAFYADFTTCKDCVESWTITGKKLEIELDQYIHIQKALLKIKGINVVFIPYVILPIKKSRESGLLFPKISTRFDEGISFQEPIFWAIDRNKDATFTPSFWGQRGYGIDLEYRHDFAEKTWLIYNHRFLNDKIYLPGKFNLSLSDENYFRNFGNFESHIQWNNDITQHFHLMNTKDLDFIRDFSIFTDPQIIESDFGVSSFLEKRSDWYNIGIEGMYRRNMLVPNPEEFDQKYVQLLPSLYLNTTPYTFFQSDIFMLQNLTIGLESEFSIFRQMQKDETNYLRNVNRLDARPYLLWNFFSKGPMSLKSKLVYDFQEYNFYDENQDRFQKYAAQITSEFSFTIDKIFGLAYDEIVPVEKIEKVEKEKTTNNKNDSKNYNDQRTIGVLPKFKSTLTNDTIRIVKNSYRHSQDFKFIHHYITADKNSGNQRFEEQIKETSGWFDYRDAIQRDISNIGSNATRTTIPKSNSMEFQWNNTLIKKTARTFNFYDDQRYLRDNFSYARIGYFNLSQGIMIDDKGDIPLRDSLTRLLIDTGYSGQGWSMSFRDYFFHQSSDHILNLGFSKRVNEINFMTAFNLNTFGESDLKTIKVGLQLTPSDTIGLSYLKEHDLSADQNIRTIYQLDLMPNNNCWIFNLNYTESVVVQRYSFNFIFNFGNDEFDEFKRTFYNFSRLYQ